MTTPPNRYHRRRVGDAAARACWICFKPSTTVLITPDGADWFHVCAGHLTDAKFAVARDAEAVAERQRQEALDREIEAVKREYEEKMRRKTAKREGDADKSKEKEKEAKEDAKDEKEQAEKVEALEKQKNAKDAPVPADAGPRIFELQKSFYQMRMQKRRDAEMARRNRERLRNPTAFPSVPSGDIS